MLVKELYKLPLSNKNIRLRIALVYPNVYQAGMSSYAVHLLFSLFNNYEGIRCERFFLPGSIKSPLYETNEKISGFDSRIMRSMDTGSPLSDFDIIAFTLQYEMDYLNVLWIIDSLGIPFLGSERSKDSKNTFPLLIGGGPCVRSNPLPLMKYLDLLCFGDLEPIIDQFMKIIFSYTDVLGKFNYLLSNFISFVEKQGQSKTFDQLFTKNEFKIIKDLKDIQNFLICPISLKFLNISPSSQLSRFSQFFPVKRTYIKNLSDSPALFQQIIPEFSNPEDGLIFGKTYLLELNRGCPYGCRFCLTGFLNRPFRNRSIENIKEIIDYALEENHPKKVTLIGSSIADHPNFEEICRYIIEKGMKIMIPSIRLNKITPEILDILKGGGLKSLTIAPETGSESLRLSLNKPLQNIEILEKVKLIFNYGFDSVKFYFLIGLPFEKESDIQAIPDLMWKISNSLDNKIKRDALKLSINPFIPKLFTPFQDYTSNYIQKSMKYLKNCQTILQRELRMIPHVSVNFMDLKEARMQTVLSMLDESQEDFLFQFYLNGGRHSVIDRLDIKDFKNISEFLTINYECFETKISDINQKMDPCNNLTYKRIQLIADFCIHKKYLKNELLKAKISESSPGCFENCHRCGIC